MMTEYHRNLFMWRGWLLRSASVLAAMVDDATSTQREGPTQPSPRPHLHSETAIECPDNGPAPESGHTPSRCADFGQEWSRKEGITAPNLMAQPPKSDLTSTRAKATIKAHVPWRSQLISDCVFFKVL